MYVEAYERGDAEAVWDMLTDSERKSIEEGIPSASAGSRTPRERFLHGLRGRWGTDRRTASVVAMKVLPDSLAYATIRIGTAEHTLELWDEDGAWRIGAISWPP